MRHLPFALALALGAPALAAAETSTWKIDPTHTQSSFAVKHLVISTVRGEFRKTEGVIRLDERDPTRSAVDVTIDAGSIHTREDKRDAHLRSADFFDTAKHPTITFKSTKIEKAGEGKYRVTGELSMHGTTRPVVLDASLTNEIKDPWGMGRRGVQATTRIDRRDFGLTWSKTVEAGPVVGNEVVIEIDAELVKQAPEQKAAQGVSAQPKPATMKR